MLVLEKSFFEEKELLVLSPGCTLFVTLQQLASLYFSQLTFLWFNHGLTARVSVKPFLSLNETQSIKQKCLVVSLVMALYSLIMVDCNLGWKHYNTMHVNTSELL